MKIRSMLLKYTNKLNNVTMNEKDKKKIALYMFGSSV